MREKAEPAPILFCRNKRAWNGQQNQQASETENEETNEDETNTAGEGPVYMELDEVQQDNNVDPLNDETRGTDGYVCDNATVPVYDDPCVDDDDLGGCEILGKGLITDGSECSHPPVYDDLYDPSSTSECDEVKGSTTGYDEVKHTHLKEYNNANSSVPGLSEPLESNDQDGEVQIPTSPECDEPYNSNSTPEYSDVKCPTPPVYAESYAVVPSTDPGGFASIGCPSVTHYNREEEDPDACVSLGRGSLAQYNDEERFDEIPLDYDFPGAIGNPSVTLYEGSPDSAPSSPSNGDYGSVDYALPGAIGNPSVVIYQPAEADEEQSDTQRLSYHF